MGAGLQKIVERNAETFHRTDLLSMTLKSPVGQNPAAKQKLLFLDQPRCLLVSSADTRNPLFKIFTLKAVFLLPNVDSQLVFCPQPLFFIHFFPHSNP